mgnify:CR=1 FL=1
MIDLIDSGEADDLEADLLKSESRKIHKDAPKDYELRKEHSKADKKIEKHVAFGTSEEAPSKKSSKKEKNNRAKNRPHLTPSQA